MQFEEVQSEAEELDVLTGENTENTVAGVEEDGVEDEEAEEEDMVEEEESEADGEEEGSEETEG